MWVAWVLVNDEVLAGHVRESIGFGGWDSGFISPSCRRMCSHLWVAWVPVDDEVVVGRVGEEAGGVVQNASLASRGEVLAQPTPQHRLHAPCMAGNTVESLTAEQLAQCVGERLRHRLHAPCPMSPK